MHPSENSSVELGPLLHAMLSEPEPTAFLAQKLKERAHSANNSTEQNGGSDQKPNVFVSKEGEALFGRNDEKQQLLSQLLAPNERGVQFSVIPIAGMGGIGKTTLARLIYEDRTVQEHFEVKAWVKVAGLEQKQLCDIARKLLKSATKMLCPLDSLVDLDEMVVDALLSQRSFIVLDDVESMDMEPWKHMKESWFRFLGLGSKIIITTRNKDVARIVESEAFELGELSKNDSWSLYRSVAFPHSEDSEQIRAAKLCKGVPLSLKLLGSLTRFEESLVEQLSAADRGLDDSVVLYICVLALPLHLFICFAYCGVFRCGYVVEKEKLIKLWIADDVVKPYMGMKMKMKMRLEDIGDDYFQQLVCRSFFTDITRNEYGEIVQARMPSVVHRVAREIATIIFKDKALYENSDRHDVVIFPFQDPKHLQKLVDYFNPDPYFVEFKRLRSLDLSGIGMRELPKHISVLKKLSYLNLSHNHITSLPNSFTTLTCLQTLDLSGCYYLKILPKKMSSLSQLRHLDLSQCNSLFYMPLGIGSLESLITMPLYVLCEKGAGLAELGKLDELRGVLLIRNLENVREISEAEAADLKHKRLRYLGLSWSHHVDECRTVLECLEPHPKLRVLDLTGYGAYGFPSWMPNLLNLVKLSINDCRCTKLPTLGKLPFLQELQLKELNNIRSIGQEFYGDGEGRAFPALEKLKLRIMHKLNNWSDHSASRAFPKLTTLSIQGCPLLQSLPSFPSITELVVWKSHNKSLQLLTRNESLSSVVINDMDVKACFGGSNSVKKLIVVHCTELDAFTASHINKFTTLEHFRIHHCLKLENVALPRLGFLQKLNVMDCQNLKEIYLPREEFTLTELVIEDCPQLERIVVATAIASTLRKLVVRNCSQLSISPCEMGELKGLEFLFISGCPQTKKLLDVEMSQISHVPCVILGR